MDAALGMKIRLRHPEADPAGYKHAGESFAVMMKPHAHEVWIWVYAHDMDIDGPALCVSYVSESQGPITEFMPLMASPLSKDWN